MKEDLNRPIPRPPKLEPIPREQLPKAPTGTYNFLEQFNGFATGVFGGSKDATWQSAYQSPWMSISKEEECDRYGGSCMAFRLVRKEGEERLDVHGHITDQDEIVFLSIDTYREGINHSFPKPRDIDRAISEIQAVVNPQQDSPKPE